MERADISTAELARKFGVTLFGGFGDLGKGCLTARISTR